MKQITLITINLLLFISMFAQNHGQNAENGAVKLTYSGYQTGHYIVTISNKKITALDVNVQWQASDTTFYNIPALGIITVLLPGDAVEDTKIKGKPLHVSGGDDGWVEIYSPSDMNLAATGLDSYRVWGSSNTVNFSWTSLTEDNSAYYRILKRSDTTKEWTVFATIDSKAPNGQSFMPISYTYSAQIINISTAGFGLITAGIIILLVISRRFIPLGLAVVIMCGGAASCKKALINPIGSQKTVWFKLQNVGKDGSLQDGPTKSVKI